MISEVEYHFIYLLFKQIIFSYWVVCVPLIFGVLTLIRYVVRSVFFPICMLYFHFVDVSFVVQSFLFVIAPFVFVLVVCAFAGLPKKWLPRQMSRNFYSFFDFIILSLTFKLLIHFKLILISGPRKEIVFSFECGISFSNTIYWTDYFSLMCTLDGVVY